MRGHHTGFRLAWLAMAWLGAVALQLHERALMPSWVYGASIGVGVLAACVGWRWRRAFVLALIGMAAIGFGSAGWRASERMHERLSAELEGVDLLVTGVVESLPQRSASGIRFRFEVEEALYRGQPVTLPSVMALGWYSGFHEDAVLTQPQLELGAGQRWRLAVRLKQPHGNLNPKGFDYELHLFEQGVGATGNVRDSPAPRLMQRSAGHPVERLRQRVRDAIDANVADRRAAGVLAALAVGDQSAIDRDDWDLFRNTGIAHLVSISGLHITMFAWLAGLVIAAAWRRSSRAALWLATQQAARWGGLVAAWAYAVFSGWGVPSQRTVWMLAAVVVLQTMGRRWPWPLVLLIAAVVVSALDPWALLQAGFWLSFVAVALLMASSPVREVARMESGDGSVREADPGLHPGYKAAGIAAKIGGHLRGELRSQVIATLGLTPLTLVFFQQVSVVGFIANVFAIPLVTLVITPLAMLGVVATPLWLAGAWVVQQMCSALTWLAAWPGAVWTVPAAPAWAQLAGLAAAALLVMPLPWRIRALSLPLVLPLLMPVVMRPTPGAFELLAADIGQGTAVLIRTSRHLLVYDTGPQYSPDSDAGQRVLLPLLRTRGEGRVDRLILSHRDSDHVGGAKTLLQGAAVTDMWSSLEDTHPLLALAPRHSRCVAGQRWEWDGVRFEVLHPPSDAYDSHRKSNAMSCVVRVIGDKGTALLTGDIEREQEAWLVATQPEALRSDVLVVPHHGSKTSSTPAFIDAVHPSIAIFQAGYRNRFGHPVPLVRARYDERRIATIDSPTCGAWQWSSDSPTAQARQGVCERDSGARYWHHGSHKEVDQRRRTTEETDAQAFCGLDFANLPAEETYR